MSSSPANQAINKGVPCQTQSKVIFQVLLDSKQASNLVKRAFRWPDMGVVSKDQELTQEMLQKMIDQLAEPFSGRKAGKQMSATFVVKPIQSPFEVHLLILSINSRNIES